MTWRVPFPLKLGRSSSSVAEWRSRGTIPKHAIDLAAAISGESVDWILTGRGEPTGRVSEPQAFYAGLTRIAEISSLEAMSKELPWIVGLLRILAAGDTEKEHIIKGNIQTFLEALDLPRVEEAEARPPPRGKRRISSKG